jgi:hypothetical protein
MRTHRLITVVALMAAAFPVQPASADDRQEILNYKLTLPLANNLLGALPEVTQLVLSQPDWKERMAKAAHSTLEERAVEAEKSPATVALLKKHGLTPRQYVIGVVSLRMALTAASLPSGVALPSSIVASPENLAFAKAHFTDLKPRMDAADRAGVPRR